MSTMICRIGRLGRARVTGAAAATNGEAAPASPSAPTRFKNTRRPILFVGVPDNGMKLLFGPLGVTENCFCLGFMSSIFCGFPLLGKPNLGPFVGFVYAPN